MACCVRKVWLVNASVLLRISGKGIILGGCHLLVELDFAAMLSMNVVVFIKLYRTFLLCECVLILLFFTVACKTAWVRYGPSIFAIRESHKESYLPCHQVNPRHGRKTFEIPLRSKIVIGFGLESLFMLYLLYFICNGPKPLYFIFIFLYFILYV